MEEDQVTALECALTEHKFEEDPIEKVCWMDQDDLRMPHSHMCWQATWDKGMRVVFLACAIKAELDYDCMECFRRGV